MAHLNIGPGALLPWARHIRAWIWKSAGRFSMLFRLSPGLNGIAA
jgi:hypothetical protein